MSEKETMLLKLLFTTIIEVSLVHAYLGETRESSSNYECRYYSELCNPDYFLPCCEENHVCIMIESLSEYYCMNHAGLGMKCREDYDCYDNYSVCSEDNQKCTCDKNYIERDGSCQPIIGGNCDATLGSPCGRNIDCAEVTHAMCSKYGKICLCRPNNFEIDSSRCAPILGAFCWKNEACAIVNSDCIRNECRCKDNYKAKSRYQCIILINNSN